MNIFYIKKENQKQKGIHQTQALMQQLAKRNSKHNESTQNTCVLKILTTIICAVRRCINVIYNGEKNASLNHISEYKSYFQYDSYFVF